MARSFKTKCRCLMRSDKILQHRFWPAAGQFLSRASFLLGLPLLAWGVDDLAGFFSNPVRSTFAAAVILQALVHAWLGYITPLQPGRDRRFDMVHWQLFMFQGIFILAAYSDRRSIFTFSGSPLWRWAGLAIFMVGVVLSVWTHLTWVSHLRRLAEYAVENPVLLFEGLYKWVRYPSLLYLSFFCLGFAIAFRSWGGLVLMVPLAGGILQRTRRLDDYFARQYKKVWPLRRHASKRLIPFLY